EPVRCALEINKTLKDTSTLRVRMGIHSGPVNSVTDVNDTLNDAGPGINVAQRIMDCGDAGHILLSRHVAGDLSHYRQSQPELPFDNLSAETANAYFADGIQDEILTRLANISDLRVISRTSTEHYKSTPQNLREIAKQLGVAYVVEGSVQKSGDAVRVNVQLIKAETDTHVWAEIFDRKLTDIFAVESEVAKTIAEQLSAQLTGREQQAISTKPTENLEAYDNYLRGLAYTLKTVPTQANATNAQKYFRQAVT